MQNRKIIISLFMISILVLIVSPQSDAIESNSETQNLKSSQLDSSQIVGHPAKIDLNASVTNVQRNITVSATAKIIFEDQITLQIQDNETSISMFNYTLPTIFDQYVEFVEIRSQFDTAVAIDETDPKDFTKYTGINATTYYVDILENNTAATQEQDGVHIKVRMELSGAIKWENLNDQQVGKFVVPVFPSFPNLPVENGGMGAVLEQDSDTFRTENMTKVTYANAEWPARRDAGGNVLEWRNFTSAPFDEFQGYIENFDFTEIVFSSDAGATDSTQVTIPYEYSRAKRHLRIDPWGIVFVTEELTIRHTGASRSDDTKTSLKIGYSLDRIDINVPRDAKITSVSDKFGTLNSNLRDRDTLLPDTTIDTDTGLRNINVILRNSIVGGEEYSLTINYQFEASNIINVDGSKYTLNTTLLSNFQSRVGWLQTTYELPAGATLKSHNYVTKSTNSGFLEETDIERDTLSAFRHVELSFTLTDVSFVDNYEFQIEYTYFGLGHFQYIITFMILTMAIMGVLIWLNRLEFAGPVKIDKTRESVPSAEIDAFFTVFTERSGATKRLEELRGKRKKGKITKKDYDGQIKAIQRRVRELNPQLDEASKNLANSGIRYQRLVDKIMLSSQKQLDIKSNSENARKAYLKGNTPKDIYQKLIRDYTKESIRLEAEINKSLTTLLEVDQDY